ncbi:MAG: 3'(2'),5'-bisphosphate nucleotidase CysQ [Candidatus Sulfobium sp.]
MRIDILKIIEIAELAGKAVMDVYSREDPGTTYKEDCSPLTLADTASQKVILAALRKLTPELPVLSEESKTVPYEERKAWRAYWLVDPLDGTKEFIKRNGEFTVNIALIEGGVPVMGVVNAPVLGRTYYAARGEGAFRKEAGKEPERIGVSSDSAGVLKVAGSRSHGVGALEKFLEGLGPHELVSMGSSLKFCLVAEGSAHLYPRLGPTMEWDTAAAQCVVEEAGGFVTDLQGNRLRYNKEDLHNPNFIVVCCEGIGLASQQAYKSGTEIHSPQRRRVRREV